MECIIKQFVKQNVDGSVLLSLIITCGNSRIVIWTCIDSSMLKWVFLWSFSMSIDSFQFQITFSKYACMYDFKNKLVWRCFELNKWLLHICNVWIYMTLNLVSIMIFKKVFEHSLAYISPIIKIDYSLMLTTFKTPKLVSLEPD